MIIYKAYQTQQINFLNKKHGSPVFSKGINPIVPWRGVHMDKKNLYRFNILDEGEDCSLESQEMARNIKSNEKC